MNAVRSICLSFMRQTIKLWFALLAPLLAGCTAAVSSSGGSPPPPPPPGVQISVSPATANIRAGDSYAFTATVAGTQNTVVTWSVNTTLGGSATFGTISSTGNYTAPAALPAPNTLSITATSAADSSASGLSNVTLLNPTPVIAGINPASTGTGSFTLAVSGSKFVSGAQVFFGATPLATTFISSAQISANGNASNGGTFAITVQNPNPGASTSNSLNLQVTGPAQGGNCSGMSLGQGANLNGFVPFPSDSLWNQDVSAAPVDPNSAALINFIGPTIGMHADFGAGEYNGSSIGIPYLTVGAQQPGIPVSFTAYGSESDPGPMPIPITAPIEGYPNPGTGDRHVLVLDNADCFLYELYSSYVNGSGWDADSAAVWDLLANEQRPYGWTSADAAGLPIFPGLARYDEIAGGQITHALRFTLQHSRAAFVPPASHWAANSSNANAAPMGMKLRLKSSFNISGFSAANQVILRALQKYGMIMADNGSSMYLSGAPDDRWDNNDLHALGQITASNFEVVQMNPIYTPANLPNGAAPQITSFAASASSVSAGTAVTLSWQVSGASYVIVSPGLGAVRETSASVAPAATTTYTLSASNAFGRTTSTVAVAVH